MIRFAKICVLSGVGFGICLAATTAYNLLDTFAIEHPESAISSSSDLFGFDGSGSSSSSSSSSSMSSSSSSSASSSSSNPGSDSSGSSSSTEAATTIAYVTKTAGKTPYFIADVNLKKISDLRTHVETNSSGQPGSNIVATTSSQVAEVEKTGVGVLAAINGDFCYWSGRSGVVIRNGLLLRSSVRGDDPDDDFTVYKDGHAAINSEDDVTGSGLISDGAFQNFSFGPALVKNAAVNVSPGDEVDQSSASNPRTAIGWLGGLHYAFFVSEGRISGVTGFSLYNVATILRDYGCVAAYNLDGGGSSTFVYDGARKNVTCNAGGSERQVSDIIYVVDE